MKSNTPVPSQSASLDTTASILSTMNNNKQESPDTCGERSYDCGWHIMTTTIKGMDCVEPTSSPAKVICFLPRTIGGIIGAVAGCITSPVAFFCGKTCGQRKEREDFYGTTYTPPKQSM